MSIPDAYGGLILTAAAPMADWRDPGRHLRDAVILLACLEDPYGLADRRTYQSDGRGVRHLQNELADQNSPPWLAVDAQASADARAALSILVDIAESDPATSCQPDLRQSWCLRHRQPGAGNDRDDEGGK